MHAYITGLELLNVINYGMILLLSSRRAVNTSWIFTQLRSSTVFFFSFFLSWWYIDERLVHFSMVELQPCSCLQNISALWWNESITSCLMAFMLSLFPLSSFRDFYASIFPSSNVQVLFLAAILFDFRTTTTAKACGARGGSCYPFRFYEEPPATTAN